jgi:hypothetical protein
MSNGSHVVGGRTYRNVPTTNEVVLKKAGEAEKLTVLTTEKIPSPKAQPATVGMDLSKMITTHDEPKDRDVEDMSKDEDEGMPLSAPPEALAGCAGDWAKKIDADFKADAKKKAGRSKKE